MPYSEAALGAVLTGERPTTPAWTITTAEDAADLVQYRRLRRDAFVVEQALFPGTDLDDVDDDPRTVVLVARTPDGTVLGGVRLAPACEPDIGWWRGSRLVVRRDGAVRGLAATLVRAACAHAERLGALRFEADVQAAHETLFRTLGWQRLTEITRYGRAHLRMRWPIGRYAAQAASTKAALGALLQGVLPGGAGFVGDDGAPVPGTDVVAACDAIIPSLVERDPEWAGWCGVLVNVNDLAAMGATPIGLLDAIGARDPSFAARVMSGLRTASQAWGVDILGGHTQFGVPAALSVTALGRTEHPVPGGGGRAGHRVTVTADLGGDWRRGNTGRQWDSTTTRTTAELQRMGSFVARTRPAAAKDVSMAGAVGTLGMLAEASGCGAVLDVDRVPTPPSVTRADWLACFPGFAVLTTAAPGARLADAGPAVSAECGELVDGAGVTLRWPDGETTPAVSGTVTALGPANGAVA